MKQYWTILLFVNHFVTAQPLVHQESHHIPVIETAFARVLNVAAESGDTTAFHIHQNDIGYFTVKGSKVWLQELNEGPRIVDLPTGWTGSDLTHSETPFIHRFANIGDKDFQLIAVEVLSEKYSSKEFTVIGEVLHENERFSIQKVNDGTVISEVPFVLIEVSESGEILILDLNKARRRLELQKTGDFTDMIIIQFK